MQTIKSVYFIGAGGIGMSALERYFLSQSFFVGGYDRTETPLTKELIREGADIHYTASVPRSANDACGLYAGRPERSSRTDLVPSSGL